MALECFQRVLVIEPECVEAASQSVQLMNLNGDCTLAFNMLSDGMQCQQAWKFYRLEQGDKNMITEIELKQIGLNISEEDIQNERSAADAKGEHTGLLPNRKRLKETMIVMRELLLT